MPNGIVLGAGSGLRLQPNYPGTQDIGNANISGVFRAGRITTSNETAFQDGEGFGNNLIYLNGAYSDQPGVIVMGSGITVGWGLSGQVLLGQGLVNYATGVNVGLSNLLGNSVAIPANQIAFGIGNQTNPTPGVANFPQTAGPSIAIGYDNSVVNVGVALGMNNDLESNNYFDHGSVVVGIGNSSVNYPDPAHQDHQAGQNVLLGKGIVTTHTGSIIIGYYTSDQPSDQDNSIIIGKPSQNAKVQIGPWDLGAQFGSLNGMTIVNDVDWGITPTSPALGIGAITAARNWTLEAASAYAQGFRILIADLSGNVGVVKTVTITPNGTDTINGVNGPIVLNTAYGYKELLSDGISRWTIIRG